MSTWKFSQKYRYVFDRSCSLRIKEVRAQESSSISGRQKGDVDESLGEENER